MKLHLFRILGAVKILLLVLIMTTSLFAQKEARQPLTIDDAINMISVGSTWHLAPDGKPETVLISPDGSKVFFSKTGVGWDTNQWRTKYYMISSKGGEAVELLGKDGGIMREDGVTTFQFSPQGSYLSFLREINGNRQVFIMPAYGGEARQLTEHLDSIYMYKWSQDEKRIYFIADEARSEEERQKFELGENYFFVDEGANGRIQARWRNLWMFNCASMQETKLTKEDLIIDELDISPDGKRVAFIACPNNLRNYPHLAELYMFNVPERRLVKLTVNLVPEKWPLWSPDGKVIAFHAPDNKNFELTKGYLWIINPDTKKYRKFTAQNTGDIYNLAWGADSQSLLFSEQQGMNTNLYQLDLKSDKLKALTKKSGGLHALAFSKDRSKMVYSFTDFNTPNDLYVSPLDNSNPLRLTDANPWLRKKFLLGEARVIRWKSKDGMEIEGVLFLPNNYTEGTKIPLMVQIHGGPNLQWANEFYADFHIYAGLGYASLGANIRGSSGYGEKLLRALIGDIGGGEYEDLMSGVDHVIDSGVADPDRLCIRGWSWGGVLSSWVITQTDRFKAASIGAMVGSWLSEMGPGFNWDLTEWYMEKPLWDDPEAWRKISSITYVQNVTTPAILFHGDDDWYSSYNQSLIFFTGLKDIGKVPVRFVSFPGRGHDLLDPWAQKFRYKEEIKWMQKYVQNME
jgi:dipeptidyl aminopeptidase/acylaminoacyl peptidase